MLQLMLQPSCEALIENKNMGRKERKERKERKGKEHTERCSPGKIYINKNTSELLAIETVARFIYIYIELSNLIFGNQT